MLKITKVTLEGPYKIITQMFNKKKELKRIEGSKQFKKYAEGKISIFELSRLLEAFTNEYQEKTYN